MNNEEKTLKKNQLYKGRIIDFYDDEIECPNGDIAYREYVHHPGGSAVLAILENKIVFEKQYRYPYHKEILELPAGKLEKGEDPLVAAKRELEEETGLISEGLIKVGELYPSPGYTDEVIYLFFSENNKKGTIKRDKDEFMDLIYLDIKEAYALLDNGEIKDSKTQILLYKLRDKLLK